MSGPAFGQGQVVLEEVVVTAQKRAQDIQDVPLSVTTLSDERLDVISSAGADIRFLAARVPSLQIESSFGRTFPRFYMRGLGNTDFDLNSSQPVSLVYDEIVLENPILKGFPVFDLDRIEVLRGPQGTLFGRNTPAGIVKFESRKPTREFEGYAKAAYGRFNQMDFEGAAGGPLSDTISGRFSALYQRRNDWVTNTFTGESDALEGYTEFAARLQLLFEPNDEFSALVNLHGRDLDGTARVFRANIITPGTDSLVPGFERDEVSIDGQNIQHVNEFGGVVKLDYDFGPATLTSVTGYETAEIFSRGDIDGGFGAVFLPPSGPGFIPFSAESADGIPELTQITQELRITNNGGERVDWTAGIFYFDEDIRIDSWSFDTLFGGTPCPQFGQVMCDGYAFQEQDTKAWAVFAAADFNVSDNFTLSGGLRFSQDEKDFVAQRLQPLFINTLLFGTQPSIPIRETTDDDNLSWNLSATWATSDTVNLYARVATAFRAPSIQGRVLFNNDIDGTDPDTDGVSVAQTEEITSYELGVKAQLLDNRMRFNFATFYYTLDDQQITAVGGQLNVNTLLNADETEGMGFEADLDLAPNERIFITAGLSYNDTEIKDPNLAIAPCGGGCTVLDPPGPVAGSVLLDGNRLPQAPEWIGNLTFRYGAPVGDDGEIYFLTDAAYRSEVNFFLYESAEFRDDDLTEVGLRIGYLWGDGTYEVAVYGRNIFDDESLEGGIDFNNLTGFVNEPPVWGVEFGARFD